MITYISDPCATQLFRYPIASADMYYCEVNQRDVYVSDDPEDGFRIWGEIPGGGPVTAIDLCQVFLEYGMYCQTWRDQSQAYRQMTAFGESLGEALAKYLKASTLVDPVANPGACALECVLESMGANFTVEQVDSELYFTIAGCPLRETARRTGLMEVELAHCGINVLCQSLIRAIDPGLLVDTSFEEQADHTLLVMAPPVYA
jgi:hypothetical protein